MLIHTHTHTHLQIHMFTLKPSVWEVEGSHGSKFQMKGLQAAKETQEVCLSFKLVKLSILNLRPSKVGEKYALLVHLI
jgi:hypothetical protein